MADQQEIANTSGAAQINADIVEEAERLVALATHDGLTVRVLGGVAVRVRCPSAAHPPLARAYGDIDLVAPRRESRAVRAMLDAAGYLGDRRLNALHGDRRLYYADPAHDRHIDVFVGAFQMCHTLELEGRLALDPVTLSLADLLLTKLQIVQINAKDMRDSIALLVDHDVTLDASSARPDAIDGRYIAGVCGRDWGWYTTVTDNLDKLKNLSGELAPGELGQRAAERIGVLRALLEQTPKSMKWTLRATIGRHLQWYEEPEEIRR
jgi:hypothetical protein